MWRNYLTVGLRVLARNRSYAFINIFGLALGLAACLLLLLFVRYETSYDAWLPGSDRIYQVQATWFEPGQPVSSNQASPLPVHDTLAGGFPQIEALTIADPGRAAVIRDGQPTYVEALWVDPSFFDIFRLPFVRGSAARALPNTGSVVLTEREAIRQFGTLDAVGRIVTTASAEGRRDYTVTGVVRDLPRNTTLAFEALFRFDPGIYAENPEMLRMWGAMGQYHYVKLRPGADAAAINAALPDWEKRVIPPQIIDGQSSSQADIMDLQLVPITEVHLGEAQGLAMTPGNDRRTVATFSIVAVLILVMACINFINLSTARAGQRAREVSLRKVLGARRGQLVAQFLGESLVLAAIAMLIALTLAEFAAPLLADYLDADFRLHYFGAGGLLLLALGMVAVVGALGGIYPAFYLARFEPAAVLRANKSSAEPGGSGRLRNILVVVQFAISIGLIVCTAVIWSQTRFVETVDPGFERDGIIQVPGAWRLAENYEAARRQLLAVPGVTAVGRTNLGIAALNKSIQAVNAPGGIQGLNVGVYGADPEFFSAMGMRLLAGRLLGERFSGDLVARTADQSIDPAMTARGLNIVVNRRAAEMFGFRDPAAAIGQQVRTSLEGGDMVPCTIVGIVENTRIRTARDEIEPLIFTFDPPSARQLIVRYRSARPADVMAGLETAWSRFLPDIPFEGAFSEDLVAELYVRDRARGTIFAGFSILAVAVSCLGLFGLASFTAARRIREIGIRKVLGARVRDIVQLLVWQFTKPVVVANLVAWPVAWWAMRDWLNTFDVRVELTPTPFALAGLLALGIAIGTIAGHAIRVARTNPIHALRYE